MGWGEEEWKTVCLIQEGCVRKTTLIGSFIFFYFP